MAEYMGLHPDVLFRIVSHERMGNSRGKEIVDFVVSTEKEEWEGRHKICLGESEQYVLLPKNHRLAKETAVEIRQLSGEPQILCTTPDILIPKSLALCMQAGLVPCVRYITDDRFSAVSMLLEENAVMFMPQKDAQIITEISGEKLVALPLRSETLPEKWKSRTFLSWKDTAELSVQARDFLSFVKEKFGASVED